jgi:transposase
LFEVFYIGFVPQGLNTAKTYLVNINAVNQWIARYKKDGIKGLNEKPHTGRIGLYPPN